MTNPTINRRNALKVATGGLLLAGVPVAAGAQTATTEGDAAMAVDDQPFAPGWRSFTIGEAKVTQILDGIRAGDGPHPTFGANQSAEDVAALMEANLLPPSRFVNFFQPTLIEIGDAVVLVDTGFGAGGRANGMGLLSQRMQAAGIAPGDVTVVALTHLHGDHIGGLLEDGEAAFPNAEIVVGDAEYAFWTSDAARSGPAAGNAESVAKNVVPLEDKIRRIADGDEIVPGLTARAAFGHTPGMLIFELVSGDGRLMLTADTLSQFVVSFQRPDWHVQFDMDKDAAAATRERVLAMLADEAIPFTGYHLPFPALGYVQRDGDTYRFVPETYRLAL